MTDLDPPWPAPPSELPATKPPENPPLVPSDPPPLKSSGLKSWLIAGGLALVAVIVAVVVMNSTGKGSNGAAAGTSSGQSASANGNANGPSTNGQRTMGNGFQRNGVSGSVTKIDGRTLTIESHRFGLGEGGRGDRLRNRDATGNGSGNSNPSSETATYTVTTSGSTKITTSAKGSLTDLAKGDTVIVMGDTSNGTVTATRIAQTEQNGFGGRRGDFTPNGGNAPAGGNTPPGASNGSPPDVGNGTRRFGNVTFGTITAVTGSKLTLTSQNGDSVEVTASSATAISVIKTITFSAIKVGDTIRATGTVSGDRVKATALAVGTDAAFGGMGRPRMPDPNDSGSGSGSGSDPGSGSTGKTTPTTAITS